MQLPQTKTVLLDFNFKLNKFINESAKSISSIERNPKNVLIATVIGKAMKTQGAILLLCENDYGEDASVLVRTLLEMLIDFTYITQEDNQERARRYMEYSWILKKNYVQALSAHSNFYEPEDIDDTTRQNIETEAKRVQKKYNYAPNRWAENRYKMAKEVGLLADYEISYRMMSSFAHTDALGLNNYASLSGDGGFYVDLNARTNKHVNAALVSTFEFLFKIVAKWNEVLNVGIEVGLKKLEDEFVATMKSLKTNES